MQEAFSHNSFSVPDQPVRSGFHMRFSGRNPRDLLLSKWIAEDTASGRVNISEILKDLLYIWYMQRHLGDGSLPIVGLPIMPSSIAHSPALLSGPVQQNEELEDPNDPLVQSFLGLSFDDI